MDNALEKRCAVIGKQDVVYILQCADGSLYTGWTSDLENRLKVHQAGKGAKYTKARLPVELVYWERCADKQSAMRREYWLKRLTRRKKLELIAGADEKSNLQNG